MFARSESTDLKITPASNTESHTFCGQVSDTSWQNPTLPWDSSRAACTSCTTCRLLLRQNWRTGLSRLVWLYQSTAWQSGYLGSRETSQVDSGWPITHPLTKRLRRKRGAKCDHARFRAPLLRAWPVTVTAQAWRHIAKVLTGSKATLHRSLLVEGPQCLGRVVIFLTGLGSQGAEQERLAITSAYF